MRYTAAKIVQESFANKTDLAGEPYVRHLYIVADPFFKDDTLCCIALLHDLLEGCPEWTYERLLELFPEEVCEAVRVLTKQKEEPYEDYIKRVSQNEKATKVKIEDLKHNMDITRYKKQLTEKDLARLVKYHNAYLYLNNI